MPEQPKKMIPLYILQILKEYTDAAHTLSQKEIQELLKSEYDLTADRKTVKSNLMNLISADYPIHYTETARYTTNQSNAQKEDTSILSDFYLEPAFSDGELRLLVDSVLSSKNIPPEQSRQMISKIEKLSNRYFHAHAKHVRMMTMDTPHNPELFRNIEILSHAIRQNKQVSFHYNSYGTDFELHPRKNKADHAKKYIVNPYQMAIANDRYYLICNFPWYDDISHCRIDRITDIQILDKAVRNYREIEDFKNGFNFPKHLAEHIYMFSGPSVRVKLIADKIILDDMIDWFGKDLTFSNETDETITVSVSVNEQAMTYWAMQYAAYVTILAPRSLKEKVKENLENALKRYEGISIGESKGRSNVLNEMITRGILTPEQAAQF